MIYTDILFIVGELSSLINFYNSKLLNYLLWSEDIQHHPLF